MPQLVHRVNVRTLAEFATQGGDILPYVGMADRMREGILGHKQLQSEYPEGYLTETPVSYRLELDEFMLDIYGRIDGRWMEGGRAVVEEIKTTQRIPSQIEPDDYPAHWAQAQLYAAILSKTEGMEYVRVRLTYYSLIGGGRTTFTRDYDRIGLDELFTRYISGYVEWIARLDAWSSRVLPTIQALPFPFESYRSGQREMAANAYIALRDGKNLLCQAPTGIGKTVAALYPALKALCEGHISKIFYLTARSTAGKAARDALNRMRDMGLIVRSVTITAKEKACALEVMECDPEICPRAQGHYDRLRAGLCEALSLQELDAPTIDNLAEKHQLCPFEFSLDLSELAEVVVCDYNYAFDPRVKLQRYFQNRSDGALLIDEAHNLTARARDMLSTALQQRQIKELRTTVGKSVGRKGPLYRALSKILSEFKKIQESSEDQPVFEEIPPGLADAVETALADIQSELDSGYDFHEALLNVYFSALDFVRVAEVYDGNYRTLIEKDRGLLMIRLWCADPSVHLSKCYARVHGAILFSATLSPMPFYRDVLGLSESEGDALLSLDNPFPPENLLVMRAPLSTRYRKREETLESLSRMILSFVQARVGNYLICFPSHAYMRRVTSILEEMAPDIDMMVQQGGMDEAARADFLMAFRPDPPRSLAAFIAMGGIFSEGVDLPGERLNGAVIVGVGIPQVCLENDTLRALYEDRFLDGYHYAYTYPGMTRVLQAAGRVIRTETDRGMVLLIDDRWQSAVYQSLMPRTWRVRSITGLKNMQHHIENFYREFQSSDGK